MKSNLFRNCEGGFSLIQLLITIGLLGGVSVFVMNLMEMGTKTQANLTQNSDFEALKSSIRRLIEGPACANAFYKDDGTIATFGRTNNANPSSPLLAQTLYELKHVIGTQQIPVVRIGEKIGNLLVSRIALTYQKDVNNIEIIPQVNTPAAGFTSHYVDLHVAVSREGKQFGGKDISNSRNPFPLKLITNASNEIVGCKDLATSPAVPCKMYKGVGQTQNNAIVPVVFPTPFTTIPTVLTSPKVGAPVGILNVTLTGFEATGQTYNSMYSYEWVAFDSGCFTP